MDEEEFLLLDDDEEEITISSNDKSITDKVAKHTPGEIDPKDTKCKGSLQIQCL